MTTFDMVRKKLESQGARRKRERDTPNTAFFETEDGVPFVIPKPPDEDGYSLDDIKKITNLVERNGLDILPMDANA
ncbi:MAG: hypothetical protein OXC62_01035 [Aestuariivita sp.]|nr:hypothetical protein [Aestuariivita sp.]